MDGADRALGPQGMESEMNAKLKTQTLLLASMTLLLGALATPAAAQSNCNMLRDRQARIRCMQQDADFYREQARQWDDHYRSERRRHEETGDRLRRLPGGTVWGGAWDAPRQAQDAYERHRDPERYREERRRQREWERRNRR